MLFRSQLELFDQRCVFLRTSKDTSRWDSPQLSATWKNWVTRCRGEYLARLTAARLTSENACLSWPTATTRDWKDSCDGSVPPSRQTLWKQTLGQAVSGQMWSTPTVMAGSMYPETNWEQRNSPSLATQANWPTPTAMEAEKAGKFDKGQMGQSLSAMARRGEMSGQIGRAHV